jgi:hypothetical protein
VVRTEGTLMAYCRAVSIPGGGTALVRFSGKPPAPCDICQKRDHTKLCDALVGRKTCDTKLCDQCATVSGKQDFCPKHKDLA